MILVIHNIRSVHNVGSLFRTADGVGVTEILLSGYSPAPTDRFGRPRSDFTKVSLGAERSVSWRGVIDITDELIRLKKQGRTVVALEQDPRSQELATYTPPKGREVVLVVGNEVGGVEKELLDLADAIVEIPMQGQKESLNVSVAAGIALFTLQRSLGR